MWTLENQNIFFKYCPSKKIKCYHAIAVDTGARPHEILGLRIEDIIWPPDGRPPTFTVSGKTGSRPLPLLRFHRYVREWIEQHPKRAVPSSILILSKRGGMLLFVRL
jgi:integrase